MGRKAVIAAALILAGCDHKDAAVEVRTVPVVVTRIEKCVAEKDIPRKPGPLPKRPKTISSALDVAVAKILELQTYADKADALLRGCAG